MKRSFISFIVLIIAASAIAQAPLSFKYQAYLRNADGTIRGSEFVTLQIRIVQGSVNGTAVYTETHNTSTNNHGMVSVSVGKGSTSSNMAAIQWGNGPYFLNITVNGVNLGTTEILSVPFALYANKAGDSFSGAYADLTGTPSLARVATTGNYSDLVNTPHLSTVAITGSYSSLLNVPATFTPSAHTHLENQITNLAHYTDDSISGLETVFAHWDKDTADDFSGSFADLTNIPPTLDLDSTNNFSGSFTDLTNIPPTLDLDSTNNFYGDMRGLPITNVGAPVNPTDAATRAYVDTAGRFSGSFNDLTDVPPRLDRDSTNNLPVSFNSLTDVPPRLDRDSTDNFSGVYTDLTAIPATFPPAAHTHLEAQITDLNHYTDADIQGNEAAFAAWDKNAADDFAGDMGGARITNLGTPVNPTDAATRAYVDASSGSFSGSYNDLSDVPATFPPATHAHVEADITNLDHYTDADIDGNEAAFAAWDKDASDDFAGDMGGARITNLGTPTTGTDAATMAYVDLLEATVAALQTQVNNLSDALDALTARVDAAHPPPPPQ